MCGLTDRLMRFYTQFPNSVRFLFLDDNNNYRLQYNKNSAAVAAYFHTGVVCEYYLENRIRLSTLYKKLKTFLQKGNLDSYVRRLAFLAACAVGSMNVFAQATLDSKFLINKPTKYKTQGTKLSRHIRKVLKKMLQICDYPEEALPEFPSIGVDLEGLPTVAREEWHDLSYDDALSSSSSSNSL